MRQELLLMLHVIAQASSEVRKFWFGTEYNKNIPPVVDIGTPVDLDFSVGISRVSNLNAQTEEVSIDLTIILRWTEFRVEVNESVVEREDVAIPLDPTVLPQFWVPDLFIWQMKDTSTPYLISSVDALQVFFNKTLQYKFSRIVTIGCKMDFARYPMDKQVCQMDFGSYSYPTSTLKFSWLQPGLYLKDADTMTMHLSQFDVFFSYKEEPVIRRFGPALYSMLQLEMTFERRLRTYLFTTFLPSSLMVFVSWGSFVVNPDMVPGRLVLLITTLLALVTMFGAEQSEEPLSIDVMANEVWVISCILFVICAMVEYMFILVEQKTKKENGSLGLDSEEFSIPQNATSVVVFSTSTGDVVIAKKRSTWAVPMDKSGIASLKLLNPLFQEKETDDKSEKKSSCARCGLLRRMKMLGERIGIHWLDLFSMFLFPLSFISFNIMYWVTHDIGS